MVAQFVQALANNLGDVALTAQARIAGEVVSPTTPDKEGNPGEERRALQSNKPWAEDERSGYLGEWAELALDFDDVLSGRRVFLGGFVGRGDGWRRGGGAGPDHESDGGLAQNAVGFLVGI